MPDHSIISPTGITTTAARMSAVQEPANNEISKCNELYKESLERLPIQRKPSVGAVDDSLEDGADAIADEVMRMPEKNFLQKKISEPIIQRVITETRDTDKEYSTHAEVLEKQAAAKTASEKCTTVKTQRWGCDTACSRAGFVDSNSSFAEGQQKNTDEGCCNKWPPFVESYARKNLSLNGVASCKGSMYKKIFKVKSGENEIRIGCTDSTTGDADHELELSPLAAIDLFGSLEFPLNKKVQVCQEGSLSDLCVKDTKDLNNKYNPAFPKQIDCLQKGCKPANAEEKCVDFGWPKGA